MRILVATDFTPRSQRAVRRAGILARRNGGDVILMHVVEGVGAAETARDVREAQRMIDEQAAIVPELLGVECQSHVVAGRLPDAVLEAARVRQVDMIVVGTGLGKDRQGLGRTVRDLIRAAPCPILVVDRPVMGPYARITVPVDLSAASARALRSVASLGLADGARVTLIHAFEAVGKPKLSGFGVPSEQIASYVESWRSLHAEEIDAFLATHGLAAGDWPTRMEEGRPEEVIADVAARTSSGLLVMGTRARTGIRRALLGSVTEAVLALGGADVLVVPPLRSGIGPELELSAQVAAERLRSPVLGAVTAHREECVDRADIPACSPILQRTTTRAPLPMRS